MFKHDKETKFNRKKAITLGVAVAIAGVSVTGILLSEEQELINLAHPIEEVYATTSDHTVQASDYYVSGGKEYIEDNQPTEEAPDVEDVVNDKDLLEEPKEPVIEDTVIPDTPAESEASDNTDKEGTNKEETTKPGITFFALFYLVALLTLLHITIAGTPSTL